MALFYDRWQCGSVDTLDCPPPPALPPRRPPWPPNKQLSCSTLRNIEAASGSIGTGGGGGSVINPSHITTGSSITSSPITTPLITRSGNIGRHNQGLRCHQTPPPPPSLAPPQYPAPPRPPSRNGGDEVRVARTGSGHGDTTSNGTSTPTRTVPSRAGWAVRSPAGPSSSALSSSLSSSSPSSSSSSLAVQKSTGVWTDRTNASPAPSVHSISSVPPASSVSGTHPSSLTTPVLSPRQTNQSGRWPERLELRAPMSSSNTIGSRPPSSASSGSTNNLARVHGGHDHTRPLPPPRLPETISTIAPLTAPLTPLSTSSSFRTSSRLPLISSPTDSIRSETSRTVGEVTLTVPRPDGERIVNEYVETPFRQPTTPPSQKCLKNERSHHHHHHHHHHHQSQLQKASEARPQSRKHQAHLLQSSPSQPVTKQPVSFTKEPANALGSGSLNRPNDTSLSIMCDFCGRCRCESCREPPPLPSRWLCHNSCYCSAETALDYASCLCCVKAIFYHCADTGGNGDSEAGGSCADEPCSCSGSRKIARWACLAPLAMILPCLLCYWPLKGCVTVCETCYARHAAQGCKCDPNTMGRHHIGPPNSLVVSRDSRDPEKRLLDPVTPEL